MIQKIWSFIFYNLFCFLLSLQTITIFQNVNATLPLLFVGAYGKEFSAGSNDVTNGFIINVIVNVIRTII